jgi:translation elongation factor EF-Ts
MVEVGRMQLATMLREELKLPYLTCKAALVICNWDYEKAKLMLTHKAEATKSE